MDLLRCVRRSNWTGEDVQSYETEYALMEVPIFRNELALHETHVGLKCECLGELRAGSAASDPVQPDVAFEISNLRRLVERGKWSGRRLRRKVVNEEAKGHGAARNGLGSRALPFALAGICTVGKPERQTRSARGARQEAASVFMKLAKMA